MKDNFSLSENDIVNEHKIIKQLSNKHGIETYLAQNLENSDLVIFKYLRTDVDYFQDKADKLMNEFAICVFFKNITYFYNSIRLKTNEKYYFATYEYLHYPTLREVFICKNTKELKELCLKYNITSPNFYETAIKNKVRDKNRLFECFFPIILSFERYGFVHKDLSLDKLCLRDDGKIILKDLLDCNNIDGLTIDKYVENSKTENFHLLFQATENINKDNKLTTENNLLFVGQIMFQMLLSEVVDFSSISITDPMRYKKSYDIFKKACEKYKTKFKCDRIAFSIVEKTMLTQMTQRYESVKDIWTDFVNYLKGKMVSSYKKNIFYRFKNFCKKNFETIFGVFATISTIAILGYVYHVSILIKNTSTLINKRVKGLTETTNNNFHNKDDDDINNKIKSHQHAYKISQEYFTAAKNLAKEPDMEKEYMKLQMLGIKYLKMAYELKKDK